LCRMRHRLARLLTVRAVRRMPIGPFVDGAPGVCCTPIGPFVDGAPGVCCTPIGPFVDGDGGGRLHAEWSGRTSIIPLSDVLLGAPRTAHAIFRSP
jgi:hypothetical protein